MRKLLNDEVGFVVSAELVIILTVGVLAMIVGLASLRDAIVQELGDIGDAFGAIDQTFSFRTMEKASSASTKGHHGKVYGAGFVDRADDCDCKGIGFTDVCGKTQAGGGTAAEGNLP